MERLRRDFFGVKLIPELFTVPNNRKMHCFFLVHYPFNEAQAKAILKELSRKGCRDFIFFGKMEQQWHLLCDCVDVERVIDDGNDANIAITSTLSSFEDFVSELNLCLEILDPDELYYLFYDDEKQYETTLSQLIYYRIPHRYPKLQLCLAGEPFPDIMPDHIIQALKNDCSEHALAAAIATTTSKTAWLSYELNEAVVGDDSSRNKLYEQWWALERQLVDEAHEILRRENEMGLSSHVLGYFGKLQEIIPFMERNGYQDGSGWWIEHIPSDKDALYTEAVIVNELHMNGYVSLTLDRDVRYVAPERYNRYEVDGALYEIVPMYDAPRGIGIRGEGTFVGRMVRFVWLEE